MASAHYQVRIMNEQRKARYTLAFSVHGGLGSQRPFNARATKVSENRYESAFSLHVTEKETSVTYAVSGAISDALKSHESLSGRFSSWHGETIRGASGDDDISRKRAPPTDLGRLDAFTGDLRENLAPC